MYDNYTIIISLIFGFNMPLYFWPQSKLLFKRAQFQY